MAVVDAGYAQRYRTLWEQHWWWRAREAFVLSWIERIDRVSPCRRILDVGCGDGLFFESLSRFGAVDGLEPDPMLIRDPRWAGRIRNVALGPQFQGASDYDLVLMLDVLEHIDDDLEALRLVFAAVRPGGRLVVTVPALPWLWSRHDVANAHARRYGARGLGDVLRASGFEVETLRYFYFWTVGPMLVRRWVAPAAKGAADYEVPVPRPAVNRALTVLSRLDLAVSRAVGWPLGSSLLAIARRPPT